MRIIEKKNLQYAKNMYVANEEDFPLWEKKKVNIESTEDRTTNKVRELKSRKEILEFVDHMIDVMRDEAGEHNKRDLKITFIFER